jgi:Fe-S cluster assembly iron-binding protein IscA
MISISEKAIEKLRGSQEKKEDSSFRVFIRGIG